MYFPNEIDSKPLNEDKKLSEQYLKSEVDATIASVRSVQKKRIDDAYNIVNGVRDPEDFKYLWSAYGLEFPSQLRHIPVLRAVFDALQGMYINQPFKWQVSSTDSDSVDAIFCEYRDAILRDVEAYYISRIKAAQIVSGYPGSEGEKAKKYLEDLKKKYEGGSFISELEIDAKNVMAWAIQRFKLKGIIMEFGADIIKTGEGYYQVKVQNIGEKPIIRALNPKEVFVTKGRNIKFIKDCERALIREKLTVAEIWTRYGSQMSKEDQDRFLKEYRKYIIDSEVEIMYYDGGNLEGDGSNDQSSIGSLDIPTMEVNYCEWKSNVKIEVSELPESHLEGKPADALKKAKKKYKFRLDLFEGTRIGADFYVGLGRNKFAVRNPDEPSNVFLTINGIYFNDRNGEPYSLPLKIKDIADKIDIYHYHIENMMALSGTKMVMANYADIPAWMGETPVLRIMKWLGFAKQGIGLVDLSQDGAGVGKFNNMSQIDMSLSNSIQYLYDVIDRLEATAYKITGVPRQSLGNITQTDGKGTTELALQGSETVLKPLFTTIDELAECFMTDVVNALRVAYKSGITGTILMGEVGQRVFSIKSKQFPLSFLNIHISNDGDVERDLEAVKATSQQLIEAQLLDPAVAIDLVTLKSLTEIKKRVREAMESKEAGAQQQAQEQIAQYEQQLAEMSKEIKKLQTSSDQSKQMELQQKGQVARATLDLKERELDSNNLHKAEELKLDSKRVDLEALQLSYGNSGNKEIKNS